MGYLSWGLKRQVHIKVKHGIIYDDIYTTGHNSLFVRSFTAFKSQLNILTLGCYPLSTSKAGFVYFWPKIKVHFPNYFTALLGLKKLRRQRQERMISLRNRAFAEEHKKCNTELCSLKRIERTQLQAAHSCTQLQAARRWNIKSENGFRASSAAENALWPIPLRLPRAGKPVAAPEKYFAFLTRKIFFEISLNHLLWKKMHLGQIFYKYLPHLAGINTMYFYHEYHNSFFIEIMNKFTKTFPKYLRFSENIYHIYLTFKIDYKISPLLQQI